MEKLLSLVKEQPDNVEVKMQLAKNYIDNNDFKSAQTVLEDVQTIDPDHLDANYILAQIYEFDEEYTKAVKCFEKIIKYQPSENFKYKLAQLYESAEDYDKSLECFMECYKTNPNDKDLLEKMAHVHRILGNDDAAIDFYHMLLANSPDDIVGLTQLMELYEHKNKFQYHSIKAKILLLEGAYSYSATAYKKALIEADNDTDIIKTRLSLADIYVSKNDFNHAIDEYLAILEFDKHNNKINQKLATAYYKMENYEAASEAYENLLAQHPDDVNILKSLAEIYLEIEENSKALNILEKVIKIEPENYSALVDYARTNIALNNDTKALDSLNYVLEKDPENVESRGVLVDFYIIKKDFENALFYVEEIKKLIPKSPFGYKKAGEIFENMQQMYESHYNYGIYHDLKGEKQLAIDEFTCALEHDSQNLDVLVRTAKLYKEISEDYIALEYYQRAHLVDKENIEILNKMGEIYIKSKEHENAADIYNKIININDRNKDIYFTLAEIYEKLRKFDLALENYKKFVDLAPLSIKTEEVKAKIEKLCNRVTGVEESEGIFEKIFKVFSKK